jgi:hypothetical protein
MLETLKPIVAVAPELRAATLKIRRRLGRNQGQQLRIDWGVEMWPTINENIPSSVLRANPHRYGRPVVIDDPRLLQQINPRNIAARMLGFDEPPDARWLDKRMAEILALEVDDGRIALSIYAGSNLVTDVGENIVAKLVTGNSATALNNANAYLGVSSNSTSAAESDTSIPSSTWKGMNATYPANPSGSSFTLQSDFLTGEANHAWNRWGIGNGSNPGTTGSLFSNKTESLGTKASGTWTLTATVSVD